MGIIELRNNDEFKAYGIKNPKAVDVNAHTSISRIRVIIKHVIALITDGLLHPTNLFQSKKKLTRTNLDKGLKAIKQAASNFDYSVGLVTPEKSWEFSFADIKNVLNEAINSKAHFFSIPFLIDGGDHVVQIFIDKTNQRLEYYDLRLSDPDHETVNGTTMTARDLLTDLNQRLFENSGTILINQNKLQNDFHNCGVHVLDVALKRLDGLTFDHFQSMKNSGQIEKIRQALKPFFELKTDAADITNENLF